MTAKEQADTHEAYSTMDGQRKLVAYNFTPLDFKRFCETLCREQREICADSYEKQLGYKYQILINSILNAKQPDL